MRSGGSEIRFQLGAEAHDREAIESPGGHGLRRRRRRGRLIASSTFRGRGWHHGAVVASTGRRANWGAFNRGRATTGRLDVSVAAAAAAATMMTSVMSTAVAATAIAHVASATTITSAPTVAAVATVTGDGLAVTTQKGDANHRE